MEPFLLNKEKTISAISKTNKPLFGIRGVISYRNMELFLKKYRGGGVNIENTVSCYTNTKIYLPDPKCRLLFLH